MTETASGAGRLSVVSTPIGNLGDLSHRALSVLGEVDAILAEDTRRTKALCSHHGLRTPLRSFHAHTSAERLQSMVEELANGAHFALVTDAGTPVVSDPGITLVEAARTAGVRVEAIPGPSAVTAALSVAGLRADTFLFLGFVARKGKRRTQALDRIAREPGAVILFEAPSRLAATLRDLAGSLGDRPLAVCRELTKVHEEVVRGTADELHHRFEAGTRGEITIVVGGVDDAATLSRPRLQDPAGSAPSALPMDEPDQRTLVRRWLEAGTSPRDAARRLARETGLGRRAAYARVLEVASDTNEASAESDSKKLAPGPVDPEGGPGRR